MASVEQKTVKGKKYYYLRHSFKVDGKTRVREKYLGKDIPKDIEEQKKRLEEDMKKVIWFSKIDDIKKNFDKNFNAMPISAQEKYIKQFAIRFTYNTGRIEGSTLTEKEIADLLEEGIAPNKPIRDIKETQAHEKLFYEILGYDGDLNLKKVLDWHRMLFEDTKPDITGTIRKHDVMVTGSKTEFPSWAELEILLPDFFEWYNKNKDKIHPIELAALVHLKFVSLHPFSDGNGRISRILMNFVLKKFKYPMIDIPYANRRLYYNALEVVQTGKRNEFSFVKHIIHRFLKEYKTYLVKRR